MDSDIERALSPESTSSTNENTKINTLLAEGRNLCRALAITAVQKEEAVDCIDYILYARISIQTNQSFYPLFTSNPSITLKDSRTFSLPLTKEEQEDQGTLLALKLLGIQTLNSTTDELPTPNSHGSVLDGTVGRAFGRKKGSEFISGGYSGENREVRVVEEDGNVGVKFIEMEKGNEKLEVVDESEGFVSSTERNEGDMSIEELLAAEDSKVDEGSGEFLVILLMTASFSEVRLPRFANHISIPTPVCFRNTFQFTLPPPPSFSTSDSTSSWNLDTRPSIRSSSVNPSSTTPSTTIIQGTFESTNKLELRWTPQDISTTSTIGIPHSNIEVKWGIGEEGFGTADVVAIGEIDYRGVSEKGWIELRVVCQDVRDGIEDSFEVVDIEGLGIIGWEIVRNGGGLSSSSNQQTIREEKKERGEAERDWIRQRRRERKISTVASDQETTPRRQPSIQVQRVAPRQPSFTSIFDVQPPVDIPLDPSIFERNETPSLMRQSEPRPLSESMMDMSFELGSETGSLTKSELELEDELEADEYGLQRERVTIIRIQLNLDQLISPDRLPTPTFEFKLKANFPSVTLLSLSNFEDSTSESSPIRICLPSFSLPLSKEEQTVVTVSGGKGGSVELLTSTSLLDDDSPDSPLPAMGGKARWRTERVSVDENYSKEGDGRNCSHRRNESSTSLVEVEVSLPPSPTQLLSSSQSRILEPITPSIRKRTTSTPTTLRNKSSLAALTSVLPSPTPLSLSYLRVKVTPVPPLTGETNWRLFNHLRFPVPFVGAVDTSSTVELEGAWNAKGLDANLESSVVGDNSIRIKCDTGSTSEGVKEIMLSVTTRVDQETQILEVGDILPSVNVKVAALEVELIPVAGKRHSHYHERLSTFELDTKEFPFPITPPPLSSIGYEFEPVQHNFDSSTPSASSVATTFSKFLLTPDETPRLSVHLVQQQASQVMLPPSPIILERELETKDIIVQTEEEEVIEGEFIGPEIIDDEVTGRASVEFKEDPLRIVEKSTLLPQVIVPVKDRIDIISNIDVSTSSSELNIIPPILLAQRKTTTPKRLARIRPFSIWVFLLLLLTFSQVNYSHYDQYSIISESIVKLNSYRPSFDGLTLPSSLVDIFALPNFSSTIEEDDSNLDSLPTFHDTFIHSSQDVSSQYESKDVGESLEYGYGLATLKSLINLDFLRRIFEPVRLGLNGGEVVRGVLRFLHIL